MSDVTAWQCYLGNSSSICGCRCARKKDKDGEPVKEWVEAANAIYTAGLQQFPDSAALHIACSNFLSTYKKSLTVSSQQGLCSPPSATASQQSVVQPLTSSNERSPTLFLAQQQPASCIGLQHELVPAL